MKRIFIFLSLMTAPLLAQQDARIDSLKQIVLHTKSSDSLKTYSYIHLINYYRKQDEDSCKLYFDKLFDFAETSKAPIAYHKYHYLKASNFGRFLDAETDVYQFIHNNLIEALAYSKQMDRPELTAITYIRLAQENARFGKETQALSYALEGEKLAVKHDLWKDLANIYSQIGKIYNLGFQQREQALQYLLKADSVYTAHDFDGYKRGFTYSFIGDVYQSLDDNSQAKSYQEKALELFKKAENEYQQHFIHGKLAQLETNAENFETAIEYIDAAISYYHEHKYPLQEAIFLTIKSDIYAKGKQPEKAIAIGDQSIALSRKNNNDMGLLMALRNQAKILQTAKQYNSSNNLAKEAETLANKMGAFDDLQQLYEILAFNAENLGNLEEALFYSKELRSVRDSLVARENLQNTKALEVKYQTTKKEQAIALLQSQNDLAEEKRNKQKILLWGIIGVAIIGLTSLYLLYRNRQQTTQKLKEIDVAKTTFFQNISHEFRTPLTLITGPIEKQLSDKETSPSQKKEWEMMQRNANKLQTLVDQILELSKIEANAMQLKVSQQHLTSFLKSIGASFQHAAAQKTLDYTFQIATQDKAWFDADALEKITSNLLSNAIKYTPQQGKVLFEATSKNNQLIVGLTNTGTTFSKQEIEQMFDRFSRLETHNNTAGTGIGLALVKQLVTLCKGEINVHNIGSDVVKFEFQIPIEKQAFQAHELYETKTIKNRVSPVNNDEEIVNDERPLLLVVDDNKDIRSFIRDSFKETFEVITANNGVQGVEEAQHLIPTLIISDVMMPKVTGMELCQQLKHDERTSHIPIILLTAKDDVASEFEGLETGADDYIVKPFSLKLLQTRVQNLIQSRLQLRKRYSKEVILTPKAISVNSTDELFIDRLKKVLDERITDEAFSTENLSEALGMSRMQLHRKLKALTGLSTSEFLRTERLKLAAILLKNPELNINEIGYQVGFSSPSYFTKCFKDTFGVLPTEYRAQL